MQYRKFGSLDWEISALGFGCMRFPKKKFLFWKKVDIPESIRIIRYAIDHGVNYIDTAYGYHGGRSEIIVGKALKDGYREKVKLVTKLPIWKVKDSSDVERFLNEQLEKLEVSYLDMYLCHALNKQRLDILEKHDVLKILEELRQEGKIKHVGFSFHDNWHVFKKIVDMHDWDMAQIQYNYMDTEIQATTKGLEYAASKGMAVVIMEPLKGGKLANPPAAVLEIFEKAPSDRTPVDWALQFLWNKPEVSCVLSGMSNLKQVKENIASASNSGIDTLSDQESAILEDVAGIFRKAILVPCTGCEYCLDACPGGVSIPRIFQLVNDLSRTGSKKPYKQYKKLASSATGLNAARDNGMASLCTKCRKCVEQCPQDIDIPGELEKAHDVLDGTATIEKAFGTAPSK